MLHPVGKQQPTAEAALLKRHTAEVAAHPYPEAVKGQHPEVDWRSGESIWAHD